MTTEPALGSLPLSYINQYDYCARRFWYMYVEGEMVENVHVLRGTLNHERVDAAGYASSAGVIVHRRVAVYSDTLGIHGFCDLLEEGPAGQLTPIEYKQGRQGKWDNDRAQLCAQALCLEEMSGRPVEQGALFYFGSRRRLEVRFTPELRQYTRDLIRAIHHTLALNTRPPHTAHRQRCNGCSLIDICLPRETEQLQMTR
jgi:CRISPR-associated exonuclease Cas4